MKDISVSLGSCERSIEAARGLSAAMISTLSLSIAVFVFLIAGYTVGFPLSRHLDVDPQRRLLVAPTLGLAVYAGVCGLVFRYLPFSAISVSSIFVVVAIFSFLAGRSGDHKAILFAAGGAPGPGAIFAAIGIAILTTLAVVPHFTGNSVSFGTPVFDHEKVAIIDEIINNGTPPHNPFVSYTGTTNVLNYYYLWYLLAATASITTGLSGWTVDAALTFVTALASLMAVIWLATGYSGKKSAAWCVIATSLIAPANILLRGHTLEPWIIQAAWVPQHVFAATVAVISVLFVAKLFAARALDPALGVLVGILSASIYASSVWVGVAFVLIIIVLALSCLRDIAKSGNLGIVAGNMAIAAVAAVVIASPFLAQQLGVLQKVHTVKFWIFPVFRDSYHIVNFIAYWIFLLPADFGFIYLAWILSKIAKRQDRPQVPVYVEPALTTIVLVPLVAAVFLHSVIANNDLGWRIVIPAVLGMMAMSSAFVVGAFEDRPWVRAACGALIVLTLMPGLWFGIWFVKSEILNLPAYPNETEAGRDFLKESDLWRAVRKVTPITDAVANNPYDLASLTPWPGDIGWAFLSHRRHCSVGGSYLWAFRPAFSSAIQSEAENLFARVFSGQASDDDLKTMRDKFLCRTLIATPRDRLWKNDLLTKSQIYKIVDQTREWKILRAN
jgi:hypothetical protein